MFLLILESIGTSELILIAVVALIVFGPRKLPQLAKTLGKTMAEFRNATSEFKSTWEREVAFEGDDNKGEKNVNLLTDTVAAEKPGSVDIAPVSADAGLLAPKVRELSAEEAKDLFQNGKKLPEAAHTESESEPETPPTLTKRDWL